MSKLAFITLICLVLIIATGGAGSKTTAQAPASQTYRSPDGLFTFQYPGVWILNDFSSFVRLVGAAGGPLTPQVQVDVVYPGSLGMAVGSYAGLSPSAVIEAFRANLTPTFSIGPTTPAFADSKAIAYITTRGQDAAQNPLDILLMAIDLGGNHIGILYAESIPGGLNIHLPAILEIAGSAAYSGPAVEPTAAPPPATPVTDTAPAPPVTEPGQPTPQPPVVQQPPRATGQVHLFYADGTMTIYNGSDTPVSIQGIALVVPGTNLHFGSNDFGYTFQRLFIQDSCIFLHLNTQPFSAPSFCRRTGTRQLTYLFGDTRERYFAWNANFNTSGTFAVMRGEETLATCPIAAGECTFEAPVRYLPYEPFK